MLVRKRSEEKKKKNTNVNFYPFNACHANNFNASTRNKSCFNIRPRTVERHGPTNGAKVILVKIIIIARPWREYPVFPQSHDYTDILCRVEITKTVAPCWNCLVYIPSFEWVIEREDKTACTKCSRPFLLADDFGTFPPVKYPLEILPRDMQDIIFDNFLIKRKKGKGEWRIKFFLFKVFF